MATKKATKKTHLPNVITLAWLVQQGGMDGICIKGLRWFARNYPNGVKANTKDVADALDKWLDLADSDCCVGDVAELILTASELSAWHKLNDKTFVAVEGGNLLDILKGRKE